MNKTELIERIAQETEVPTTEAQRPRPKGTSRPSSGW